MKPTPPPSKIVLEGELPSHLRASTPSDVATSLTILLMCALALYTVFGLLIEANAKLEVQERQQVDRRTEWMLTHECKPFGYAGKWAERTYKCNDGVEYLPRDMPK